MRIKAHIYLSGVIGENNDFFSMEPAITASAVRAQLDENSGAEEYIFHITSRGGSVMEAFAIHDMIAGLKNTTTIGEGMVASAGTILLLSGVKRKMTKYSELMIHNPFTIAEGDADELQKTVDELQRIEDKLSQFYADKTGKPAKSFDKWMKEETYMSADEAMELGFISEVIEPMKAVALLPSQDKNSNQNLILSTMTNLVTEVKNTLSDLKNAILGKPQSLDLTTADGKKLVVNTDSNKEKLEVEINNTVTLDGAAPKDGDVIIPALGKTFTVAGGKITAINDTNDAGTDNGATSANQDSEAVKALKDQLKERDEKIASLTSKVTEQETALNEINLDIQMIKSNIVSGGFVAKDRTQNFNKGGKTDKPKNAMQEAADRRKEEREKSGK